MYTCIISKIKLHDYYEDGQPVSPCPLLIFAPILATTIPSAKDIAVTTASIARYSLVLIL